MTRAGSFCVALLLMLSDVVVGASLADPLATESLTSPDQLGKFRAALPATCPSASLPEKPLSLLDVIDRALCNNPQTRQVWANAKAQAALVGVARSAYLPSLNATVQASRGKLAAGFLQSQQQTQTNATLTFDYLLFDFGGRSGALESAHQALAAANWTQDAVLQGVLLAALTDYYQLIAAQAAVDATRESERSALESYNAAAFRHQIGVATIADELQAQTAYAQAQLNRTQAEGNARIAHGVLANVMGLDADANFDIAPVAATQPDETREQNVRQLIEDAKRQRPDLAAAEAQVKAAEAAVTVARASGLPTVSLIGASSDSHSDVLSLPRTSYVGVAVSVPLFSGFSTTYRVRNAEAQLEAQSAQRDALDRLVALDVWRAYQNLDTSRSALDASNTLLKSAGQSADVALGRYKAGVGSILDLLNAQASLANARVQQIQSLYGWYIAKAVLAQAIGRLDPSLVTGAIPAPAQ